MRGGPPAPAATGTLRRPAAPIRPGAILLESGVHALARIRSARVICSPGRQRLAAAPGCKEGLAASLQQVSGAGGGGAGRVPWAASDTFPRARSAAGGSDLDKAGCLHQRALSTRGGWAGGLLRETSQLHIDQPGPAHYKGCN